MAYYGRDGNALLQSARAWINSDSLPTGVPIPRTGKRGNYGLRDGAGRNSGVMGNSRILPHRYRHEGDNGPDHRRSIRRHENIAWRAEWREETECELREMMAYES